VSVRALCVALIAVLPEAAPTPVATPTPAPLFRLKLDVDRHVEHRHSEPALLRFAGSVEVVGRAPEAALEQSLRSFDFGCGPPTGVPTFTEMRELQHRPGPYLDYLALARLLKTALSPKKERFFIYRMITPHGESYILREERMPVSMMYGKDVTYEMVNGYRERSAAVRAWRALERGDKPSPESNATPPPPWSTTTCRVPR
jgi:hypothetical protein